MKLSDFDYDLPEELIAQEPLTERDASRLLVVRRGSDRFEHALFRDLPRYLVPGDVLVVNETRVLPVRLLGMKEPTGGRVELLLLRPLSDVTWEALVRPSRRVPVGTRLVFGGGILRGEVVRRVPGGLRHVTFLWEGKFEDVLARAGSVPLPPYIKKPLDDAGRYQTVYAQVGGSAAAPTAGLHFTPALLEKIKEQGVLIQPVVLHIGLDTFRPVRVEKIEEHRMHEEYYLVPEGTAEAVNTAKREKRRVVAVGTTVTRCLETAGADGSVRPGQGWSSLFIYPGYRFRIVDALITNFHLPRSTLLMLVCAFAGRERILAAYREAIEQRYRFYSFGDAMLIV
ncbi:MAG: S-adenosylmethionine:tRNA ribosyltransferase-isomerase [Clostridia bacterium 62_21]|nr:MAG: S-adenosylmethionine:tRNA ribosyltransferase-isomerase [Clostridia bacterium 62_21]HAG07896.1 tRNA preQ1(34) S-adenosylmethionine ribosyltransferase-isomerase QueA [Peptococcaceae bacterium]